jgi:hypothetical protein
VKWNSAIMANQIPVGLEDKLESFLQVSSSFRKGAALGIHAGNFLDGGDVRLSARLDDGSELFFLWRFSIKQLYHNQRDDKCGARRFLQFPRIPGTKPTAKVRTRLRFLEAVYEMHGDARLRLALFLLVFVILRRF